MLIPCLIRKEKVAATPEEQVRQGLLRYLIEERNFPASHIAVERSLSQMPHLSLSALDMPSRRADIVCFAKGIHGIHELYPLLLIECKAVKLTPKVINQVVGYNVFMQAYFVAVSNKDELKFGWKDREGYKFVDYIPAYQDMILACLRR